MLNSPSFPGVHANLTIGVGHSTILGSGLCSLPIPGIGGQRWVVSWIPLQLAHLQPCLQQAFPCWDSSRSPISLAPFAGLFYCLYAAGAKHTSYIFNCPILWHVTCRGRQVRNPGQSLPDSNHQLIVNIGMGQPQTAADYELIISIRTRQHAPHVQYKAPYKPTTKKLHFIWNIFVVGLLFYGIVILLSVWHVAIYGMIWE